MTTKTIQIAHPGHELWADWLEPLDLTVGKAAAALGVTRKTLSAIVNGAQAITPQMSVRLGKALGTAPDYWAAKQLEYDMAEVNPGDLVVRRLTPRHFRHAEAK